MNALSGAERQRTMSERRRDRGLVAMTIWVPKQTRINLNKEAKAKGITLEKHVQEKLA